MLKYAHFMETVADIRKIPALEADSIHIWGAYVPDLLNRLDALHGVLCGREKGKAERFRREQDRQSSIVARGALRILLSSYTAIPSSKIAFDYSKNGKPHVVGSDIDFNVSHSGEWVVLAFGRERNIGVDIEKIKRNLDVEAIASRFFSPDETALIKAAVDKPAVFFDLWARKEAYVKAQGSGLFQGLGNFTVPIGNGELPEMGESNGWIFRRLESGSKYAAAVVTDKALRDLPCYDFGGLEWQS